MKFEVPKREQLHPEAPAPVKVGALFPGGWSVAALAPRLTLEQRWTDNLLRRAVIPFGPIVLTAFLIGVTKEASEGVRMLALPLAGLLVIVALLGLLNFQRQARRKRSGVLLRVDASGVTGYPEARSWLSDYFVALQEHPRSSVRGATLTVYRDPRHGTARARLAIELQNGAALVGPEASGQDLEWQAVRDSLVPAAVAVAQALGSKLSIFYPWCEQRIEL